MQQGSSFLPQGWQVSPLLWLLVAVQARSELEHCEPARTLPYGQQGPPEYPQGAQAPSRQARPDWHSPPQQGWPGPPQSEHLPALHTPWLIPKLPSLPIDLPQDWPSPTQVL